MKIAIFGATGTLGRHLVAQALDMGYQVTAFARRPERLDLIHANLTLLAGDVLDPGAVSHAVKGQDAVIVAIGAGRKGRVRAPGTANVIDAMKAHKVRRLISQSTLGAGDSRAALNFIWKHIMFGFLLKDAYSDHQEQEALVRASGLDWTLVRPSAFTDEPATGAYRENFPPTEKGLSLKISRADVAGFILKQVTGRAYLHQAPGISL